MCEEKLNNGSDSDDSDPPYWNFWVAKYKGNVMYEDNAAICAAYVNYWYLQEGICIPNPGIELLKPPVVDG